MLDAVHCPAYVLPAGTVPGNTKKNHNSCQDIREHLLELMKAKGIHVHAGCPGSLGLMVEGWGFRACGLKFRALGFGIQGVLQSFRGAVSGMPGHLLRATS